MDTVGIRTVGFGFLAKASAILWVAITGKFGQNVLESFWHWQVKWVDWTKNTLGFLNMMRIASATLFDRSFAQNELENWKTFELRIGGAQHWLEISVNRLHEFKITRFWESWLFWGKCSTLEQSFLPICNPNLVTCFILIKEIIYKMLQISDSDCFKAIIFLYNYVKTCFWLKSFFHYFRSGRQKCSFCPKET